MVRNPSASTYLSAAIKGLKNVHVLAADVVDYASLQVSTRSRQYLHRLFLSYSPVLLLQAAANKVSEVTGGKLDVLIHSAVLMDPSTVSKGFDSLYVWSLTEIYPLWFD